MRVVRHPVVIVDPNRKNEREIDIGISEDAAIVQTPQGPALKPGKAVVRAYVRGELTDLELEGPEAIMVGQSLQSLGWLLCGGASDPLRIKLPEEKAPEPLIIGKA